MNKFEQQILKSNFLKSATVLYLIFCLISCRYNLQLRMHGCGLNPNYFHLFAQVHEIENFTKGVIYNNQHKKYYKVEEKLKEIGYGKNIPIILKDDFSFNIILFIMDRPGFTNMGTNSCDSSTTVQRIKWGARLLAVEQPEEEKIDLR